MRSTATPRTPMDRLRLLALLALVLTGCCAPHVEQREELSRTFFDVDLASCDRPLEQEGAVGGEHMDVYTFLGEAGTTYEITITWAEGNGQSALRKDEDLIEPERDDERLSAYVVAATRDARFSLDVYAHPSDTYTIRVARVQPGG